MPSGSIKKEMVKLSFKNNLNLYKNAYTHSFSLSHSFFSLFNLFSIPLSFFLSSTSLFSILSFPSFVFLLSPSPSSSLCISLPFFLSSFSLFPFSLFLLFLPLSLHLLLCPCLSLFSPCSTKT